MYAENNGKIGDVNSIDGIFVHGILHENNEPFSWKIGTEKIKLIEFGSFNPKNSNYVKGGKVIRVFQKTRAAH